MPPPAIAVVDSDTAFLELMAELLTDEGYAVRTYKNGPSDYRRLKVDQPTLIILGISYTVPNHGRETLNLLRLDPTTAAIPIIVCTADSDVIDKHGKRLASLGIVVQEKPFLIEDLLAKVAQGLGRR